MTENELQLVQMVKLFCATGFATAYGFGGIHGKWKRRVLGSLFLTASIIGISLWMDSFSYWLLLCAPFYFGALTKGYGGDEIKEKIIRRSIAGGLAAVASLPVMIIQEAWTILAFHIVLCLSTSIVMGVINPFSKPNKLGGARVEETIIGFTYALYPLMVIQ